MPVREQLGRKQIIYDARRLRTAIGLQKSGGGGGGGAHTLLGTVHSDAEIAMPAEGALILANSTPAWDILQHPDAAGYALVTSAATWTIDQTPAWTGDHTWDDGSGDSPALVLVGGSNDDTAKIYLNDDAVSGNSDLMVQLVANDDDTRLIVEQLGGTDIAYISGAGNAWFEGDVMLTDDAFVGISGGGRFVFDTTPAPDQIDVTAADLYFATAAHGIIHVDGVAAGYVLLANGTRYVPAAANANLPIAPGARGHIIRGEAGPVWASYNAATNGAVLIGDGNDIVSDTTPTIAGLTTFATGWVNTGGTGDLNGTDLIIDTDGDSYLHASADDVVDLVLAGASGEFGITINGAEDFTFTANSFNVPAGSSIYLSEYMYHLGDVDTYLRFTDDQIVIRAGGATQIALVEAATDYVSFNTQVQFDGQRLYLDADVDSYLHASADDVVDFVLATASGELGITINGAEDFTFTANSFNVASGSIVDVNSILKVRSSGDETSEADIWMSGNGAISAEGNWFALIDSNADSADARFEIAKDADTRESGVSGTPLWSLHEDSVMQMRLGAVDHGATNVAKHTDTFLHVSWVEATSGGARIIGLKDGDGVAGAALLLRGVLDENADTTKTTAGRGIVEVQGYQTNGADLGNVVADGNVMVIRTYSGGAETTRFIFDTEGSAHGDVEWTTFDEYDDLALLDSLEASFGQFAEDHQRELEALGIARFDETPGHAMVNWTRLSMLLVGAARQTGQRLARYERALLALGADPALLEAH